MSSPLVRLRPFAPALLVLWSASCVASVRPVNELSPGRKVFLSLTDQGTVDMKSRFGPGVFRVAGQLQRIDSTTVTLAVSATQSTQNTLDVWHPIVTAWSGEIVTLPLSDVAGAAQEHVSAPAVTLAVIGIVGIVVSAVVFANSSHHLKAPTLPSQPVTPFP